MSDVRIAVRGMTCEHCKARVEKALADVKGVFGASVELSRGTAEVDFDEGVTSAAELVAAIKAAGYDANLSS